MQQGDIQGEGIEEDIERALETLRPGLRSDGFDLGLQELLPGGEAVICLQALPAACLECLVPDDVLLQIVNQAIRKHAPGVGQVSMVKKGFEGLPA
jgi:Fe-S cluster biogenesis protein NfuA